MKCKINVGHLIIYAIFALLIVYVFAPYLWLFTASISPAANLATKWPENPTWTNFTRVFSGKTLMWIKNSLLIAVSATLGCIVISIPAGYALSRGVFSHKGTLMYGIILTRVIPTTLLIVPLYSILFYMKLLDLLGGVVLVYVGISMPLNLWVMKGAVDAVPMEVEEAAHIDGASRFKILTSVILPLIKPGLGAVGVLSFMGAWGGFIMPLIVLTSDKKYPISVGLFSAFSLYGDIDYSLLATLCLVYLMPIIVIYLLLSNSFASGMGSIGGARK